MAKGRGRMRRRCSRAARRWAQSSARRGRARGVAGASSRRCSWACRISCTRACREGATSPPMSRSAAGASRAIRFEPKDHVAIGETLGMDFEAAGRISGARFVVMTRRSWRGCIARSSSSCSTCTRGEHGYTRGLRAVPGAAPSAGGHRASCRSSSRTCSRCAASRLFPDSDRRGAGHQSGARSDPRGRRRCR